VSFTTQTATRAAAPLFAVLRAKYASALCRDADLSRYCDKIAAVFFTGTDTGEGDDDDADDGGSGGSGGGAAELD
jgi:hypothetical protein